MVVTCQGERETPHTHVSQATCDMSCGWQLGGHKKFFLSWKPIEWTLAESSFSTGLLSATTGQCLHCVRLTPTVITQSNNLTIQFWGLLSLVRLLRSQASLDQNWGLWTVLFQIFDFDIKWTNNFHRRQILLAGSCGGRQLTIMISELPLICVEA